VRGEPLTEAACRVCGLGGSDCYCCPDSPLLSESRTQGSVMFLGRVRDLDEVDFVRLALHAMDESQDGTRTISV